MAEEKKKSSVKARVQKFGSFLSGMIMPNIGAFIAWGLITALFIPTGWLPNETFEQLVGPMITYLLPLLIAYTGGKIIYDVRGGVVGAIATMGVIIGADIPMFLGAMIMGPLAGFIIKKIDNVFLPKVRQGFEMLYNNFSAGILGALLAMLGVIGIGPVIVAFTTVLAGGVQVIVNAGLLPLVSIFIEPGKVLFLNNAINHGILSPLGAEQALQEGKSILFMLETNPGPGLGILLAYMVFGKGMARQSASGASVIHFFGGIHEIYFPYILMKPLLILAAIGGGMSGIFVFTLFNAGLSSSPSPGSIIAYTLLTPQGNFLGVYAGVIVATVVSFLIASVILKRGAPDDEGDLQGAAAKMQDMKGKKSAAVGSLADSEKEEKETVEQSKADAEVNKVVFACDAGMGSSAMGASILRNKFKKESIDIEVTNTSISNLPADADIVITHKDLTERAKDKLPDADHISVDNFLGSPKYDELVKRLK
ncbi:PTS mannitol transporter subunit IICB [Bacillus sp. H-16]|uniref:PTS mannitol transporter subunit IICB n=1 Tax=Alteribacter salitolerans TaxID=2912333 RepID=UPI001963D837|nr:PTS mannitol transporter subunit IICB [Alteribacter salitolerans]MBM7096998.1 PTS mannitol transporter subunit IICB [Alteribacter salitolerans]